MPMFKVNVTVYHAFYDIEASSEEENNFFIFSSENSYKFYEVVNR